MSNLARKKKRKPSGSSGAGRKVGAGLHLSPWTAVGRGAAVGLWRTGERHELLANGTENKQAIRFMQLGGQLDTEGRVQTARAGNQAGPGGLDLGRSTEAARPLRDPGAAGTDSLITVVRSAEASSGALRRSSAGLFTPGPGLPAVPAALHWKTTGMWSLFHASGRTLQGVGVATYCNSR